MNLPMHSKRKHVAHQVETPLTVESSSERRDPGVLILSEGSDTDVDETQLSMGLVGDKELCLYIHAQVSSSSSPLVGGVVQQALSAVALMIVSRQHQSSLAHIR